MTVVGSDNFADAPLLPVGYSSAFTPNAGYGTEVGEPTAWGGKTAWWRVVPTVSEFHYIDVLWSEGSTRAWVYRQDGSGFGGLLLVSNPGADTQGGWNANAGSTYYIRLDSDGSDFSYVASVGMQVYDTYTERYPLTGPDYDSDPMDPHGLTEDYFSPSPSVTGEPWESVYYGIAADAVSGAPGTTETGGFAEINIGQYVSDITDEYPGYHSGLDWYGDPPDTTYGHPVIVFGVSSEGATPIPDPAGYDRFVQLVVVASKSGASVTFDDGTGPHYPVNRIRMDGQSVRNLDYDGDAQDPVAWTSTPTEYLFRPPQFFTDPIPDYDAGTLYVGITPDLSGVSSSDPQPQPTGVWRFYYIALQVTFISDDPLPYEPPPPPGVIDYLRNYPVDDADGFGSMFRHFPIPRRHRNFGGHY